MSKQNSALKGINQTDGFTAHIKQLHPLNSPGKHWLWVTPMKTIDLSFVTYKIQIMIARESEEANSRGEKKVGKSAYLNFTADCKEI